MNGESETLPFVRGSETSRAAAESMKKIAPRDEARVYALFEKVGLHGATDKEIEVALDMSHESASARRNGLVKKGMVKDSGGKRLTPSKRKATVWVIGKGVPVVGAKNRRGSRPPDEKIRAAIKNVRELVTLADIGSGVLGQDLSEVLAWLEHISKPALASNAVEMLREKTEEDPS
jgi:hypothetical protein